MPDAGRAEVRSRPRGPARCARDRTRRACERSLDGAEHARRIGLGACAWTSRGQRLYAYERRRRPKPYRWMSTRPALPPALLPRSLPMTRTWSPPYRSTVRAAEPCGNTGMGGVSDPPGRAIAERARSNRGSLTPLLLPLIPGGRQLRALPRGPRVLAQVAQTARLAPPHRAPDVDGDEHLPAHRRGPSTSPLCWPPCWRTSAYQGRT